MMLLQPAFLWLLPLVALVWVWPRRGVGREHGLLRSALFALLVFGLARPVVLWSSSAEHHVVVVDRSASLGDATAVDRALAAVSERLPAASVRTLIEIDDGGSSTRPRPTGFVRVRTVGPVTGSPLGAALELALREIPEGVSGAVTLLSDGLATDPRWGDAMQELTRRDLPLHTLAMAARPGDVRVVALDPLDDLRVGHTGRVRVVVVAEKCQLRVELTADDEALAAPLVVDCDGRLPLTFEVEPRRAGFVRLRAAVEVVDGVDAAPGNESLARTVAVRDPIRVLYLGDRIEDGARRLGDLLGAGFAFASDIDVGTSAPDLAQVDLVVLDDRPARTVPDAWQRAIVRAVCDRGTGLLLSGGRSAFGPGGWSGSILEEISPVESVQKEEKKDPSTALAIVIDTSGSMMGERLVLAKEIARLAVRRLQPHDKVGIVEFYGTKRWAAPMQSAANAIDLQRALARLGANGGTLMFAGIQEAYYALLNTETRHKHVLILTDAGVEPNDYEKLLRKMHDDGIAVSTVLVGPGRHDEFLVQIANWGGGRYYHAPDRFNVPELLLKKPSTAPLPAYREGVFAVAASHGKGWWGKVDADSLPALASLVETRPRPGASVLLAGRDDGRPVLTTWHSGLGRVSAFATEPVGPGTRAWRDWPGYGPFLARVLARTARSAQEPFGVRLQRRLDGVDVELQRLIAGSSLPYAAVGEREVALREVAPGVFRGSATAPATAEVRLALRDSVGWSRSAVSDPLDARAPETQVDPDAALPLALASGSTGGLHVPVGATLGELPVGQGADPLRAWPLWPWVVLLSLLAFVADVYHRRRATGARGIA